MANIWARFNRLIDSKSVIIGTVVSIDISKGTSKIQPLSGGTFIARGTDVAEGFKCYVMDGVIVSITPSLTVINGTIDYPEP